jgi:hypothetical protein
MRRTPDVRQPKEPLQDGRSADDKDANEQLEREQAAPSSQRTLNDRQQPPMNRARRELENEDTGEWVATERFTLDDELEDTWPNVPVRHFDD